MMNTLRSTFNLAMRQLLHSKMRFATAIAGVSVAVMLMLVQLGIREAAYETSLAFPLRIQGDIVILSPRTVTFNRPVPFSKRCSGKIRKPIRKIRSVFLVTTWKKTFSAFL